MKSRRNSISLHGFLNLHKPAGPTSQQTVTEIRRALAVKVGHCGTLDPSASGVLPLCLGGATRLAGFLHNFAKGYEAWVTFGIGTTTLDAAGEVTCRQAVPALSRADLERVIPCFRGEIRQIPPLVSAIHFRGQRLYQLARRGESPSPPARTVSILRLRLLSFRPGDYPSARLEVVCSSGTYIRSLCRDLGEALGCPAHVFRLVRTMVGPFRIEHSVSLKAAVRAARDGTVAEHVVAPGRAALGIPTLCLEEDLAYEISHGREIALKGPPVAQGGQRLPGGSWGGQLLLVNNPSGSLLALCEVRPDEVEGGELPTGAGGTELFLLRPKRVLLGAAGTDAR